MLTSPLEPAYMKPWDRPESQVLPLFVNCVDDAYVANVDDAMSEYWPATGVWSQRGVVVELTDTPAYESRTNGQSPPPPAPVASVPQ